MGRVCVAEPALAVCARLRLPGRCAAAGIILAPAQLTNAYGFEFHPNERFALRLSPFAPRLTIVRDLGRFQTLPPDVVYGVSPNHTTRWEILAAQLLATLDQPLGPNANFKARYLLFTNYGSFRAQDINQRLDVTITAKVYGLLSVNFQSTVLYQYDQDPGIQFSQGLGLGLLLTRQNPPAPMPRAVSESGYGRVSSADFQSASTKPTDWRTESPPYCTATPKPR